MFVSNIKSEVSMYCTENCSFTNQKVETLGKLRATIGVIYVPFKFDFLDKALDGMAMVSKYYFKVNQNRIIPVKYVWINTWQKCKKKKKVEEFSTIFMKCMKFKFCSTQGFGLTFDVSHIFYLYFYEAAKRYSCYTKLL